MSVSATPYGVVAAAAAENPVTLSGTSGSPNLDSDSFSGPFGAAVAGWVFGTDGTVTGINVGSFNPGVEWTSEGSPGDYWIRATLDAGTNPTSGTMGSWLKVSGSGSSSRTWQNTRSGSNGTTTSTLKIEISTDSGGSTIVGTGYYKLDATVTGV